MPLNDQQLAVAFYRDETHPEAACIAMTWGELVETLTEDRPSPCTAANCAGKKCPHKSVTGAADLGAWSPVELTAPMRNNDNVAAVHALVLDGDGITPTQLEKLRQGLLGASYVAHTSHRHRADSGLYFVRVVVQLSRPVPAAQWKTFHATAVEALGLAEFVDKTCKDLSRLYFLPTHPSDVPFLSEVGQGEPLRVEAVLSRSPQIQQLQHVASQQATAADHHDPAPDASDKPFTNLGALVKSLKTYRRDRAHRATEVDKEKAALVGRLLAGEPLAAPGGCADPPPIEPSDDLPKGRGYALARVARICTGYLPADTPDEAYLQIFANSLDAMCFGRPADREEMEEHLLEKIRIGRDERRKWDEERAARNTAAKVYMTTVMEERARAREAGKAVDAAQPPGETETPTDGEPADDAWMDKLQTSKNGEGLFDRSFNAHLILKNHIDLKGCFKWNDVDLCIDVFGMFSNVERGVLDVHVANYLAGKWGLNLRPETVMRQIDLVAFENRYDPIKEYLRSLKWDGVSRVDDWVKTYTGAWYDDPVTVRKMGRKWLVGAAARALDPGVKMDLVLVLEGKQGKRKTSLLEELGGEWYADMAIAIGDKDAKMVAARSWISELPDLAALKRKSEVNAIKAFFTTRIDTFRPPFGRAVIKSPRRNVFAATTNDDDYLTDPTGNRRYLCVRCEEIDIAAIRRDRDQLWAEAVHLYNRHVAECEDKMHCGCWWFEAEEAKQVEELAEQRAEESPHQMAIIEWWTGLLPQARPKELQTNSVAKDALNYTQDRVTSKTLADIGAALVKLGFVKQRVQEDGKRRRFYTPTDELLALPQSEEGKKKSMSFKPALKAVP